MTGALTALTGARIFDGLAFRDGLAVLMRGRQIEGLPPVSDLPSDTQQVVLNGGILAPGFVDLQVNGGGGVMLNDAPTVETLRTMAAAHRRLGATSFLPTLITDTPETTEAAIKAVVQAIDAGVPGIAGLHLEGPHLSVAKAGAHDPALIRPMLDVDLALYCDAAGKLPVLKLTVAPDSVGPDQIAALAKAGVLVSLGHSNCTFDVACRAAAAGARTVTHLFNAMSPLGSREPGLVGAALTQGALSAGVIADGIHVHPETLRAALTAKSGPGQIYLVSDAMAVAGTDLDAFELNGRTIRRREGRLTLADGTLAGADLDMAGAVRRIAALTGDLAHALAMATSIPAHVAGIERAGRIASGGQADLVWLGEDLRVRDVWQAGERRSATEIPHTPQ